jgi:beta-aspartyl-peptidase (threonine type)
VLVHAGAGPLGPELREGGDRCRSALEQVLARAGQLLGRGAAAVEVVVAAVELLEDCELFNAGIGAALCSDGTAELSAAVMRGSDQAAGAVACIRSIRHPVRAAEALLEAPEVLMFGAPAERLAVAHGLPETANETFVTERQRRRLLARAQDDRGTVGAVCLDASGALAAATSTGGIMGQAPGRIGDSPLPGAGTWADRHVAVSCTGDGEAFIRVSAAHTLATGVAAGRPLPEAAEEALAAVGRLGGTGGLIVLDALGNAELPFTTEAMPRGLWREGEPARIWLN